MGISLNDLMKGMFGGNMVQEKKEPSQPKKETPRTPRVQAIKKLTTEEKLFLKQLIIRATHRRIISQEESLKALDILQKL